MTINSLVFLNITIIKKLCRLANILVVSQIIQNCNSIFTVLNYENFTSKNLNFNSATVKFTELIKLKCNGNSTNLLK
jgi:hypothetical protein